MEGPNHRRRDNRRFVLATLIPLAAFVLQWVFWDSFKPFAWIFFYPAVFFTAWIGGLRCGLASIAVSTLVIWWFFIPNRYTFITEQPAYAFTMLVFTSMGVLFSFTFERLRQANQQAANALAAGSAARDQLEERVSERTAKLERTANALRESEREFRTLAEAMPQIVWITRPDGWNIYFNPQWVDYTGLTLEESYGHGWNTPFHPDDKQRAWGAWQRATQHNETYALECRLRRADGVYRWWLIRGVPVRDAQGSILKWFGTCTDIEDIKQAEASLQRSNRALRMISECNQALVRATAEADLLQAICQLTVEHGGYRMVWVGFAERNEAKSVRPVAQAGFEAGYLDMLNITWADDKRGSGPTGTAIRTGQLVIARDIPSDPAYGPWRAAAIQRGYASSATLPLISGERVFGALMVYAGAPDAFNAEEIALLTELAGDLAYGITALRTHAARERADAERQKFVMLADSSSEFIGMCDLDLKPLYVNPAGVRMVGLPDMAAACQIKVQDYFFPEDQRFITEAFFPRVLREGQGDVEIRLRHFQTGEPIWMFYYLFSVRDASGEIVGWATVSRDITERRRAEAALRESESRYRALFAMAGDAVFVHDQTGRILDVNQKACHSLGYTREELLSKSVQDVDPEAIQAGKEKLWPAIVAGESRTFESRHIRKDGRTILVEITLGSVRMQPGLVFLGIVRDITERKQAEQALRHTQTLLQSVTEGTSDAIYVKDLQGRYLMFNPAAARIVGKPIEEVLGRDDTALFAPDEARRVMEGDRRVMASGSVQTYEEFVTSGGVARTFLSAKGPMHDAQGEVIGLFGIARDITEHKQAEADLRQSRQQLRDLSAHVETLREEERTRISREIHDELGQMLTGIKMDLRWMEHRLDDFGEDRRVNPILDKLVVTAELTDATVRTVQRIAAELRPGILDKLGLPMALQYEVSQFIERTGTACDLILPPDDPSLRFEVATAFFRIFQEALTNVTRHAHATAVEVELRVEAGYCRLEIRDNGQGITPVNLAHPKSLGLLGMRERARMLGGEVTFAPRPGGGTVVAVRIPNVQDTQPCK